MAKLFLLLSFFITFTINSKEFVVNKTTPVGFENITKELKISFVDFYVGKIKIGTFEARYNKNQIKILNHVLFTKKLIKKTQILKDKIKIIENELSTNKNTNYKHICYDLCEKDLILKTIEFIFNEKKLTANVRINPNFFTPLFLNKKKYDDILKKSNSGSSLISKLNLSYFESLDDQEKIDYNLNIDTKYSINNKRINMMWNFSDGNFNINNIYLENDFSGKELSFGFLQSNGSGYSKSSNSNYFGIHYGTSYNTRMDLKKNASNPIKILLNYDSLIKVYNGDKLVYVGNHNIGNNQLFIENLPFGTYKLKIVKTNTNGLTEEYVNYTKTNLNLPKDEILWSFDSGYLSKNNSNALPEITKDVFSKLSLSKRIGNNFALYTDLLNLKNKLIFSPSFYYNVNGDFIVNSSLSIGNNESSKKINLHYNKGKYNFDINYQVIKEDYNINNNFNSKKYDSFEISSDYDFEKYGNISVNFKNRRIDNLSDNIYNITYKKSIYNTNNGNLNLFAFYNKENSSKNFGLMLSYKFKKNNYTYKTINRYENRNKKENIQNSLSIKKVKSTEKDKYDMELSLSKEKNTELNNFVYNYDNYDYGKFDFNIMQNKNKNFNKISYFGNVNSNLVLKENNVLFGYNNSSRSGIVIDLTKYDEGESFSVIINGIKKGLINSSEVKFIPLESYKEYSVKILPTKKSMFIKTDNVTQKFSLYPGNIKKIDSRIYNYKILFTKLIDHDGKVMKNTKVKTSMGYYYSDNNGFIEIEFDNNIFEISSHICDKIILEKNINFQKRLKCNK